MKRKQKKKQINIVNMAKSNSCVFYPEVNGKRSKLYKDLLDKHGLSRPMTNYIYARYLVSNMGNLMDSDPRGYKRNSQGEHKAKDVLDFINISALMRELTDITKAEIDIQAIDSNGKRIDYYNAQEALEKAEAFNRDPDHKALIAYVRQYGNGDMYNIIVAEKNATNNTYAERVTERLKIWELYKQVFNAHGIDIENLPPYVSHTFNAFNTDPGLGIASKLQNIQRMSFDNIHRDQAQVLFALTASSPIVQRLISTFGSIEGAADALDALNNGTIYTNHQEDLLRRAVTYSQDFIRNIDLNSLEDQVRQMSQNIKAGDPEIAIAQKVQELNRKYNISANEIHRTNTKINSLSEAAADAVFVLKRRIRELEDMKGNNAEGKRLEGMLSQLMKELDRKKYYSGLINFLQEAGSQISEIDNMIRNTPQTGTETAKIFANVKTLQEIKQLRDMYYNLVDALADEHTEIDEDISSVDIANIRSTTRDLKKIFDDKDKMLRTLTKENMVKILTMIMGDEAPNGQPIVNIVEMASVDSSLMDFLYSVGRASNPVIAAMGAIIREAQNSRDKIMNDIDLRTRRATHILYKSGSNSKFMYEDEGHIISDIDWKAYSNARKEEYERLVAQGLRDFDLKQAIEDWEDANTEDRIVDTKSGRTEKVPDQRYRNNKATWDAANNKLVFNPGILTKAQQDYYDAMMQIKGEIGTLLPHYAQHHYLPPQVRRSMLDAISEAKSAGDVVRAIWHKIENFWTIREDDENYYTNGIIDSNEFKLVPSDYNNTPLRQIPIFHINRVQQGELLRNFSAGTMALAKTAINYHAMNSIVDIVEFMGDFVKTETEARDKKLKVDIVQNKQLRVMKALLKWGRNTNNEALIDGFISKHIYGQKYAPSENQWLTKMWGNIIAYTSFRGLSTNIRGAFSNYLVGEFQMMIEAGAGEHYGWKDFLWAHTRLFGGAGVGGEIMELLTNNVNHKGVLFREKFDPINENFATKGRKKYYKSMFRQLLSQDCSFIGYASGEYLIHYVNMYAILHNIKVKLGNEVISLYDAYEVTNKQDGNSELHLKQGVTDMDGNPITEEWENEVRKEIRNTNQNTHGSMNDEDKGLIHQRWWGRGVMNFRQWMIEHYSRRYRKSHFDDSMRKNRKGKWISREGYWVTYWHALMNEDTKDTWAEGNKKDAIAMFARDLYTFTFRAQSQWTNLTPEQRANVARVRTEMTLYLLLCGLSFALGEPDEHKREFWRRWWIYHTKRIMLDTEASMPHPKAISSALTIFQSPMAGIDTLNSLLYVYYGLTNGDLFEEVQSGPHKGENRYWRNVKKNVLPFYKDWESLQNMDTDDAIFKIFEASPNKH